MKANYEAWDIAVEDFAKQKTDYNKLLFFLRFAILAPSSHNSQPWEFSIDTDNFSISVYKSQSRTLPVGDPNDDLSYISIGCAIENIVIMADYFEFLTQVVYEENNNTDLCASLHFTKKIDTTDVSNHLALYITKRVVNRGKYKDEPIPDSFLETVENLNSENYRIIFNTDKKSILGKLINDASINLMNSKLFRKELSCHVKNNFTHSRVGIPAFGMNIPSLPSLLAPVLVRIFNMDKLNKNQNEVLFTKYTPAVVIITSKTDTKKDKIVCGQLYEKIALLAIKENIKTSPWGAPTVHKDTQQSIQKILDIKFYPEFLFRIGYNNSDPHHSPRLLVNDVIRK